MSLAAIPVFSAENQKVIRVAFPQQKGLSEIGEDGVYTGYTYEYLEKLSQFTGWEYTYVTPDSENINDQLMDAFDMLAQGKVDLIGAMLKSDGLESVVKYPENAYGTVYTTLVADSKNYNINEVTYLSQSPLVVGLWENVSSRNEETIAFLKKQGVNFTVQMYATVEEQLEMLHSGGVDVIPSVSLHLFDDVRTIVSFSPRPFYFVANVSDTELVGELDKAIAQMNICFPNFQEDLWVKYFEHPQTTFSLSSEDRAYLKAKQEFQVLCLPNAAPYSFTNKSGEICGIGVDLLRGFAGEVGREACFTVWDGKTDFMEELAKGAYDCIVGIPGDADYQKDMAVISSSPFLTTESIVYFRPGYSYTPGEYNSVALLKGSKLSQNFDSDKIIYFDTPEECIYAVRNGLADIGCGNQNQVEYYAQNNYIIFDSLALMGKRQEEVISVRKDSGMKLLSILNRYILSLPDNKIYEYSSGAIRQAERNPLELFIQSNPMDAVIVLVTIVVLVFIIIFLQTISRRRMQREHEKNRISEERFRIAIENTSISIWEFDFKSRTITQTAHSMAQHGLGMVVEDVPRSLVDMGYVHPDDTAEFLKMYRNLLFGKPTEEGVFRVRTADGSGWWYEHIHYTVLFDDAGTPFSAVGISEDVTEKHELAKKYYAETQYYEAVMDNVCAMMMYDLTTQTLQKSEVRQGDAGTVEINSLTEFFSREAQRVHNNREIQDVLCTLSRDSILQGAETGHVNFKYEYQRAFPHGEKRWVRFTLNVVVDPKTGHQVMFAYLQDIDRHKKKMKKLQRAAETDSLTGLYNHKATFAHIDSQMTNIPAKGVNAFLMIDVDRFKQVNDGVGHQKGDEILRHTAGVLKAVAGKKGIAGRLGGDEFVLFVKHLPDMQTLEKMIRQLSRDLQMQCISGGIHIPVTSSIGAAVFKEGDTARSLYERADKALYRAKENGRNNYCIMGDEKG